MDQVSDAPPAKAASKGMALIAAYRAARIAGRPQLRRDLLNARAEMLRELGRGPSPLQDAAPAAAEAAAPAPQTQRPADALESVFARLVDAGLPPSTPQPMPGPPPALAPVAVPPDALEANIQEANIREASHPKAVNQEAANPKAGNQEAANPVPCEASPALQAPHEAPAPEIPEPAAAAFHQPDLPAPVPVAPHPLPPKAVASEQPPREIPAPEIPVSEMPAPEIPVSEMSAPGMPAPEMPPRAIIGLEVLGLGPGMLIRLNQLGIHNAGDLATGEAATIRRALGDISRLINVEAWISRAQAACAA